MKYDLEVRILGWFLYGPITAYANLELFQTLYAIHAITEEASLPLALVSFAVLQIVWWFPWGITIGWLTKLLKR